MADLPPSFVDCEHKDPVRSEDHFLELLDAHFPRSHPHVLLGRGDDAAIVTAPGQLAVSADLFLEDVHFRRSYFSPRDVGHKALAVNLSDMAAMGASPLGFALQCFGPATTPAAVWDGIFRGMAALAKEHGVALVGGDVTGGPCLGLGVTVWGEKAAGGRFLTRTALAGDALLLVGAAGLARTGLSALEAHGPGAAEKYPRAVAAHLRPVPQVRAGLALAALPDVRGCMDVSDGLARDLPRLLGPNLGAELDVALLADPDTAAWAGSSGLDPAAQVYLGGEDYALLVAADGAEAVLAAVPDARLLGRVTAVPQVTLDGRIWTGQGFDHFRTS